MRIDRKPGTSVLSFHGTSPFFRVNSDCMFLFYRTGADGRPRKAADFRKIECETKPKPENGCAERSFLQEYRFSPEADKVVW